jgi:hypothetical protein
MFHVSSIDGPTDVKTKFHSPHSRDNMYTCTAAIDAVILQLKLERYSTLFAVHDVFDAAPKEEVHECWRQDSVASPTDPLTRKSFFQSSTYSGYQNGLVHHLVGRHGRQLQLLSVGTRSALAYAGKLHSWRRTTRWPWGFREHAAPNPAIVGVYKCHPRRRHDWMTPAFMQVPTCRGAVLPSLWNSCHLNLDRFSVKFSKLTNSVINQRIYTCVYACTRICNTIRYICPCT